MRIRRETMFKAVTLMFSLAVGLLISELVLRIVLGAPPVWKYPQERYRFDPEINHRLEPDQTSWTHGEPVLTNHLGYRAAEYTAWPADGVKRIIALGDSQTFGIGLPENETWPVVLKDRLTRERSEISWQVINAGIPATNTWQHERLLKELIGHYHPQAVVLAFFVNDVARPFIADPPQVEDESGALLRLIYLGKRSALLSALRQAFASTSGMIRPSNASTADNHVVDGTPDPLVDAAWESVESSLVRMAGHCRESEVRFLVVALPRRDQISGRNQARAYNQRIQEVVGGIGAPMVDTLDALQELYVEAGAREVNIPWDGHHTKRANETIVDSMIPTLLGMMLTDRALQYQK